MFLVHTILMPSFHNGFLVDIFTIVELKFKEGRDYTLSTLSFN